MPWNAPFRRNGLCTLSCRHLQRVAQASRQARSRLVWRSSAGYALGCSRQLTQLPALCTQHACIASLSVLLHFVRPYLFAASWRTREVARRWICCSQLISASHSVTGSISRWSKCFACTARRLAKAVSIVLSLASMQITLCAACKVPFSFFWTLAVNHHRLLISATLSAWRFWRRRDVLQTVG